MSSESPSQCQPMSVASYWGMNKKSSAETSSMIDADNFSEKQTKNQFQGYRKVAPRNKDSLASFTSLPLM